MSQNDISCANSIVLVVEGVGLQLLICEDCGFESHWEDGSLSLL